jgi:hypothetical protein
MRRRLSQSLKTREISVISKGREHPSAYHGINQSPGYPYPVLFPFGDFLGMHVADPRDIACMKITAIAGRGSKRDFVDLYAIAQLYGLKHLLELFKKKYFQVDYNVVHLLKSLTYFKDAEKEPMPDMRMPITGIR